MTSDARRVRLKFDGPAVTDGKVPLLILAEKLKHLQKAIFNIASGTLPRRGSWSRKVQRACELRFVEVNIGSLEVISELPPPEEFEVEGLDLGVSSLQRLRDVLSSVTQKRHERIVELFPDSGTRARVMKSVVGILPNEGDDYDIVIGMDSLPEHWVLQADDRDYINESILEEVDEIDAETIRVVTGKLFRIEIDTAERHIALEVNGRRIKCRYPDYLEETISQFVAGSLVEVKGRAVFDSSGNVSEIKEIIEVDEMELAPVTMKRVKDDGRTLEFKDPISVSLDFRNGLWVYEFDPLGILAYADNRKSALRHLREEFFVLWDDIRGCDDEGLTSDAQELKKKLVELVQEGSPAS